MIDSRHFWWHICFFATSQVQTKKSKRATKPTHKDYRNNGQKATTEKTPAPNSMQAIVAGSVLIW